MEGIKQLNPAAMERAVITLERAFASDPMFHLARSGSTSALTVPSTDESSRLQYGVRYGQVTESHDGMAVAIWIPPGRSITPGGMIRCGMLAVPFGVGFRPFAKFMGANDVMGKFHEKHVPEPHWYLLIVGVDPALQGRGVGAALVKEGMRRNPRRSMAAAS